MKKTLQFMFWVGLVVLVVGIGLRLLLFEPWTIPLDDPYLAASIEPSLGAGDTILVMTRGTPAVGDLVRCAHPEEEGRFVVGRIVGEGGDTVEVKGGTLSINGTRYTTNEACKEDAFVIAHPVNGGEVEMQCKRVEIGGGWHFQGARKVKGIRATHVLRGDIKKDVGLGMVFLLSDNRDFHYDSRDFGSLPVEDCQEQIVFRTWGPEGWLDGERRMTVIH